MYQERQGVKIARQAERSVIITFIFAGSERPRRRRREEKKKEEGGKREEGEEKKKRKGRTGERGGETYNEGFHRCYLYLCI